MSEAVALLEIMRMDCEPFTQEVSLKRITLVEPEQITTFVRNLTESGFGSSLSKDDTSPVIRVRLGYYYSKQEEYEVAVVSILVSQHFQSRLSIFAIDTRRIELRVSEIINMTPVRLEELILDQFSGIVAHVWSPFNLGRQYLEIGDVVSNWEDLSEESAGMLVEIARK